MSKDIIIEKRMKFTVTTKNGIMDEQSVSGKRINMLLTIFDEAIEKNLIKIKQQYPSNDISEVDMEASFVIITDITRYNKLLELEAILNEEQEKYKFIEFPKLEV
jgi:hypothetical protein